MLKKVRHAGLAVVFHAAADEIGRVDGRRGLALIGKQNNFEAIVELEALDALDGIELLDARGRCIHGSHCSNRHK